MSSETIVTALFLISAVVAAGVLINAVFPVISRTTETFGSVSHTADTQMRTDIKIVNAFASGSGKTASIWLKNVGTSRIASTELNEGDVFIGTPGSFERQALSDYQILESSNSIWDPGETLEIHISSTKIPETGNTTYFAIVLPSGVKRSTEFTAN